MKRPRQITTELTPLLDVILILLFLVLSQNNTRTAEVQGELDKTRESLEQAQSSLEQARDVITGLEEYDENSLVITISITGADERRTLYVADKESTRGITYGWDNLLYGENALKNELEGRFRAAEGKVVFISFVYDSEKIYKRDHDMVISVLDKLQGSDENLYVSYKDTNERTE